MQRSYLDAADTLYLQPRDFTGTPQALDTPEGFYPTTGVNSLTADASEAQGAQILDGAITGRIADGNVDAANPVVVFGYSQSSALSTFTMQQLQADGVPSDDVHFVLVGDTAAPNGGLLERFDLSDFPSSDLTVPSFGVTFGNPTPDDLYPTDIYTLEYDGFADFPQYPIDPLSDLNAFAGMIYEHLTYLDLDPGQIQNAIPLETLQSAGGTLTDYYMIGVQDLPLLDPLRLIPFVGNPLADLLQPDVTVLVNLGYGSIADGWSQGPANVPTPFDPFPTDLNWSDILTALVNGVPQGIQAAIADLENPDNYQIPSLLDNPTLAPLVDAASSSGLIDTLQPTSLELTQALLGGSFPVSDATLLSPPADLVNDLASTLSADYAALLPIADTINALTTSLPAFDASLFSDQLGAGDLLGAIGDPIAADVALIPFALFLGAGPITDAVEGTLLNIADLIP
ncbi:MAG: PE-PPE domain-containing protein [Mycobacterium sp.]|nr:PE-PPE domain-containing protein [Mycobacterium sp.]